MQQLNILENPSTIDQAFWKFHKQNPHVFVRLVRMTREAKAAGKSKVGIGMMFEVLRWESLMQTQHTDFKLNNNFRSRYVRIIEERCPDLVGMFEKRTIKS